MTSQVRVSERLQEILSVFYAGRTTRDETRSAVLDVVLERMRCARVSFWKFSGDGDELALLCFASKSVEGALDTSERRLRRIEYRDYFNALIERGTYLSVDAMKDPALQPMRESYLVPNNVLSMLDAAFLLNGRAYGMVCCEETSAQRHWRASDVIALRAIVTKLAVVMSGQTDSVLWTTPSVPLHSMPLTPPVDDPTPPGRSATDRRG
jgi:GAF domain-containing protein